LHVPGAIFIYYNHPDCKGPTAKALIIRHKEEGPEEPTKIGDAILLSMVRACKQLHAECCPVLYGEKVFRILYLSPSNLELPLQYRQLVQHAMFITKADHQIYKDSFLAVDHALDKTLLAQCHRIWQGHASALPFP
jgi:hypothetical protein